VKRLLLPAALLLTAPAAAAAAPVTVSVSVPAHVTFADTFQISVRVLFDEKLVDGSSIRVDAITGPLTALAPPELRRVAGGLSQTQTVACLDAPCLSLRGNRAQSVVLPSVRVRARTRSGRTVSAVGAPSQMVVRSRLTASEARARSPKYVRQTSLPVPRLRIDPSLLAVILLAGAMLLLGVAAAVALKRRPHLDPRAVFRAPESPLERALRLVRASLRRPPPDRRRALDLLATALEADRDRTTADVTRLAWSAPEPTSGSVEPLLHELDQRRGDPS
jgi:hypothetical protein